MLVRLLPDPARLCVTLQLLPPILLVNELACDIKFVLSSAHPGGASIPPGAPGRSVQPGQQVGVGVSPHSKTLALALSCSALDCGWSAFMNLRAGKQMSLSDKKGRLLHVQVAEPNARTTITLNSRLSRSCKG